MKDTELRKGNYVLAQVPAKNVSMPVIITGIYSDSYVDFFDSKGVTHQMMPIQILQPVELEYEWLLRLGFDGIEWQKTLVNGIKISFEIRHDGWSYQLGFDRDWLPAVGIEYVHQLQNLYFALTGHELEIKQ